MQQTNKYNNQRNNAFKVWMLIIQAHYWRVGWYGPVQHELSEALSGWIVIRERVLLMIASYCWSYLSFPCPTFLWLLVQYETRRQGKTFKSISFMIELESCSIMRGEECCWCVPLLDIPSNSFLKTWQSAKKSILCETRKSIFAGRRWSDSVFLPGRLSAQPWSQEQGTPTPFFPNSSFSLTPRTSQFSAFLLTSRHFTEHTFCSNFSTGPGYLKQFRHLSFIIRKTGKNLPPPLPRKKYILSFSLNQTILRK